MSILEHASDVFESGRHRSLHAEGRMSRSSVLFATQSLQKFATARDAWGGGAVKKLVGSEIRFEL